MPEAVEQLNQPGPPEPAETDCLKGPVCCRAGFLPVPLEHVPPNSLADLRIYIENKGGFSLYRHPSLPFSDKDHERLMQAGTKFVFVEVQDHQRYFETLEKSLDKIVSDPRMQREKKVGMLYSTSMELANQLLEAPPGKDEINRTATVARATVSLIMNDNLAFGELFDVFNHDLYTATHMINVCSISIALAMKLGLAEPHILQQVGSGAMLHDIGKLFLPRAILNNPGKLSDEQWKMVQCHVTKGHEHITATMNDVPEPVIHMITQHHERLDGSGYPKGLKDKQISSFGRLAAIVDTFEAMTSVRPYRERSYTIQEALDYLKAQTPARFDREIMHAFSDMIERSLAKAPLIDGKVDKAVIPDFKATDYSGPKHTHFYFRIPVNACLISSVNGKITRGTSEQMIAHKLSCMGIGLLSPRAIPIGRHLHITGEHFDTIQLKDLIATVMHCRDHGGGWFTIDARFHKLPPADIIDKIRAITDTREISPLLDK